MLAEKESATRKQTKASCLAGLNRLRNEQTLSKSEQILVGWLHQCIAKNKTNLRRCAVTLVAVVSNGLFGALIMISAYGMAIVF